MVRRSRGSGPRRSSSPSATSGRAGSIWCRWGEARASRSTGALHHPQERLVVLALGDLVDQQLHRLDAGGLDDGDEVTGLGTDPTAADTDGDGLDDPDELRLGTDPTLPDSDGDGTDDGNEVALGSNPLDPGSIPGARAIPTLGALLVSVLALALAVLLWGRTWGRVRPLGSP